MNCNSFEDYYYFLCTAIYMHYIIMHLYKVKGNKLNRSLAHSLRLPKLQYKIVERFCWEMRFHLQNRIYVCILFFFFAKLLVSFKYCSVGHLKVIYFINSIVTSSSTEMCTLFVFKILSICAWMRPVSYRRAPNMPPIIVGVISNGK